VQEYLSVHDVLSMATGGPVPKLEISKVHDAYAAGGECPLCALAGAAEQTYLRSFQHSRVMEPNVRVMTNRTGFCPSHSHKLYAGENKLGVALVLHTHLREQLPVLRTALGRLSDAATAALRVSRRAARLDDATAALATLRDRCFICDLLGEDLERYAFTILYLWGKDPDFLPTYQASRGFCVPHFLSMLGHARKLLKGERLERWVRDTAPLIEASLQELDRDLLAFTQLYQDANRSMGSEQERTALARTLQKLEGSLFKPGEP
jgi:hypothetical protein